MFEFLREWTKPTAVKRQETLNAYLDEELSSQDRVAFERLLADDAVLQQELADRELIKSQLRQLPRVAVPRNFILDVNKYRKPAKRPLITYYPVLRGATALTAVIFIFTLGWGMMGSGESYNAAPAQEMAMEVMVETAVEEMVAEAEEVAAEAEMPEMERMPADGIVEAEEAPAEAEAVVMEDVVEESIEEVVTDAGADDMSNAAGVPAAAPAAVEGTADEDDFAEEVDGETEKAVDKTAVPTMTAMPTVTVEPTKTAVSTPTPPIQPEPAPSPALTSTQIAQLGLFILFITLLALTLYARRQR